MAKLTQKDYEKIAKAFIKKDISRDKAYKMLAKGNFSIEVKGKLYTGVYASNVLAIMHEHEDSKSKKGSKVAKI